MQKSIKGIRQEFKKNGVFYTPEALALRLKSYIDFEPQTVYDPTCGAGNLLRVFPDTTRKYGQELDAEQVAEIDIPNFTGAAGDTLIDDAFPEMKFDAIVANPPFSVKWNPDVLKGDVRFQACPEMPPAGKADWAFMLHILHHMNDNGIAVVLCFPGILYRQQREGKVRSWFIENNYIDRIVNIPGKTFEDTAIPTAIVILRKNRNTAEVIFEDGERSVSVPVETIKENDCNLSVNMYIQEERPEKELDAAAIDDINRQVVQDVLGQVRQTLQLINSLERTFTDDKFYKEDLINGLKQILQEERDVGIR